MRASGERQTRLRRRSSLSDDGRLGGESEVGQDALDDGGVRKERENPPRATAVRADQDCIYFPNAGFAVGSFARID